MHSDREAAAELRFAGFYAECLIVFMMAITLYSS